MVGLAVVGIGDGALLGAGYGRMLGVDVGDADGIGDGAVVVNERTLAELILVLMPNVPRRSHSHVTLCVE